MLTLSGVYLPGNSRALDITIEGSCISRIRAAGGPARELWVTPGVIDVHTHLAWTDFNPADQEARKPREVFESQVRSYRQTVYAGVTAVRDAGGLTGGLAGRLRERTGLPLDMDLSLDLLDAADAQGPEYLVKRAAGLVDSGASWIKLMVTGGIGTPCGEVLEPRFSEEEISAVVRAAHSRGAKVMAHVWGGAGLDWVIRAGVDSAEHGVYITGSQAEALALAGIVLVPTAAIYRMIADGPGGNKGEFRRRAARAAEAHPRSIRRARDAGVPIALGTDFGGPGEHGRNLAEIDALVSCGLSRGEAWTAATVTGAALLGRADRIGSVKPGFRADLIIFTADPYKADTGPPGIAGIIASGKLIRAESSLSQGINYF